MSVNTTAVQYSYVGDGAAVSFPTTFAFLLDEQVEVYLDEVLQTSGYSLSGQGDANGGTVVFDDPPVTGTAILLKRNTPKVQDVECVNNVTIFANTLERVADLAVMRDQETAAETAGKLSSPTILEPGYLAIDADGRTYPTDGIGSDAALRGDLGAQTGATLVGTLRGGSMQTALDLIEATAYRYNRDYPPGCAGVYYGDCWPTDSNPMATARMGDPAIGDYILVRVWHDNIVDEYVMRDPKGYNGVDGGWYLWARAAYVQGRYKKWFESPVPQTGVTNSDWAIRIGPYDQPYVSGGDGPVYAYRGFGHGGANNTPANNSIALDGAGANLQSLANWPVGRSAMKFGQRLIITSNFKLVFFGDTTERVSVDVTQNFGRDAPGVVAPIRGYIQIPQWQALTTNVGWQDSTFFLFAADQGVHVDRAKLAYTGSAIPLVRDGIQKGNWNNPGPTGKEAQFYHSADPTIIMSCEAMYGPPLRVDGVDQNWTLNRYGRVHVTDDKYYAKFRMYLNSSEEVAPRNADLMTVGTVYSAYAQHMTVYRPGGPL